MRFRPSLPASIASGIALILLVNLGLWQVRRHGASTTQLTEIHAHLHGAAATNADLTKAPADLAWRKALVTGQYTAAEPFLVSGHYEFGQPGYDVISVFQPDGGALPFLVNRGWIPDDGWKEALAEVNTNVPVGTTTTLDGLLMEIDGTAVVEPIPATDRRPERWPRESQSFAGCGTRVIGTPWYTLAGRSGQVAGVYLVVGPELKHDQRKQHQRMPVSGYVAEPYQIDHVSYAIQWFSIAGVLIGAWAYSGIRRGREV